MLRKADTLKTLEDEVDESQKYQTEVSYIIRPDFMFLETAVVRFLNKLTGYNHLMTLNEQLIKHQLRTKFILEALAILHKIVRDKAP